MRPSPRLCRDRIDLGLDRSARIPGARRCRGDRHRPALGILGGGSSAHASATLKGTHGNGFCNSAFFITHTRQLGKEYGLTLEFVNTPTFAEMVTFFGAGMVDVSVLPYTSFIGLYDKGAPVKIIGGGGIEGCVIVAQPGLDTPAKLKGKTLGTFQMDTLEVLPYELSAEVDRAFAEQEGVATAA